MLRSNQFISLFIFSLLLSTSFSQNIITVDGKNMGPRKYFIEACAGDSEVELNPYQGYSSIAFCNCMADDLIPLLTEKEIDYYFAQNNHAEIYKDTVLSKIAMLCMVEAQKNWKQPPPPQEERIINLTSQALIDSIVELVDYEILFDDILQDRLQKRNSEKALTKEQWKFLNDSILFEDMRMTVIKNAYSDHYSTEELTIIYEYLSGMSSEELNNSTVKYEQIMIDYFTSKIDLLIEEQLK